jgi:hypothetical protein
LFSITGWEDAMHDINLRLTVSAAIRAQGRLSAHPDDIRAAQAEADGIIGYLLERGFVIERRVPHPLASSSMTSIVMA